MNTEKTYDGIAWVSTKQFVPFHFERGVLELFLGNAICKLEEGMIQIIGQRRGMMVGGYMLFHFPLPIDNYVNLDSVDAAGVNQFQYVSMGTVRYNVDYYIDDYVEDTEYSQLRFSFPELDNFIPSTAACKYDNVLSKATFIREPSIIKNFDFLYEDVRVSFTLRYYSFISLSSKSNAETKSELLLEFAKTKDIDLLLGLYQIINRLFIFLCNRQNISLDCSTIIGNHMQKRKLVRNEKEFGDKVVPTSQILVICDKHKDSIENNSVISDTIRFGLVASEFEKLFDLFIDNKVSVFSIHSSRSSRNLMDLKQCLNITSAFEYYQRTYLPKITSESTDQFYQDMHNLIKKYAEEHTGKLKKKANNFSKTLTPVISLNDKICKVYSGYDGWYSLKNILSEWFGDDITELANIANVWRNELAHEKREYDPCIKTISAIRLVEHLNYCIVLRSVGFSDDQTKSIIKEILAR